MSKAFSNKHKKGSKQKQTGNFRIERKESSRSSEKKPFAQEQFLPTTSQPSDVSVNLKILLDKLYGFEEKYGISTLEFYAQFRAGKMGDSRDFIKWAGAFDLYQHLLQSHFQPQREVA